VIWLVALALVAGCPAPQRPSTTGPAPSALEAKLVANPNDAKVNFELGRSAEATGDTLRAEQYYLRAEALGHPQTEILPRLLRVLAQAQRYHEALRRCDERLRAVPEDRETRYVKAALLLALDRPRDAERELQTLIRQKPADADAYLQLGRIYRDAATDDKDRAQVRALYEKYLALAPDGSEAAAVRYELVDDPRLQLSSTTPSPASTPAPPTPAPPAVEVKQP
jgi:cytochrome c-type biogenesis protein CcmH/NrfG